MAMMRVTGIFCVLALVVLGQALTPSSYLNRADVQRIRAIFAATLPYGSDLQAMHYAILGFSLLDEPIIDAKKACDNAKANVKTDNVESVFYATSIAVNLKKAKVTCTISVKEAEKALTDAISEQSTTVTIYHAVASLSNLGLKIDATKLTTALTAALKADDAPLSSSYAFLAASFVSGGIKKIHDSIEDVIAQADEIDEKYLQFEGGLYTTAQVIEGAYKLSAASKTPPTLTEDKVIKFTNYLLSRKHAQQPKNAVAILSVFRTLTDNQFHIPLAVTLASTVSVSEKNPVVQVRVSTLTGKSLGKLTVTADSAKHFGDDAIILSKKQFTVSSSDDSLYELDLMKVKPARGFYTISISITPQKADKRLLGTTGAEVEVKVTTQVAVENVEIGVADKDQSLPAKTTKLQHPNKAANLLEADHQQKITLRFQLRDKSLNKVMTAHQTFVRLTNAKTLQEIVFVSEPDATGLYKFDLDVGHSAGDFGHLSGKYSMELIIGDAVVENPFSWVVADVALTFQEGPAPKSAKRTNYLPRPEIKHLFREPEKRPSVLVSNLFTGLCLLPLAILIVAWFKLGANISNFPVTLSAIGFHIGLGAIFGLFYCYFLTLNMFETLRYLGLIGIPTFLFGNRLLSGIAAKRKEK